MKKERIQELEALDAALFRGDGTVTHPSTAVALRDTRAAAQASAEREYAFAARRKNRTVRLRWVSVFTASIAAGAVAVLMLVPAPLQDHKASTDTSTANTLSDDSLLTAVQSDLSASVPSPMEALTPTTSAPSASSSTE